MIILQGNGGSGIGRWQLGSVAEKVVRLSEKQIGLPDGAMEKLLQMTLKNPEKSFFWKLCITRAGGRNVVDEKLEIVE